MSKQFKLEFKDSKIIGGYDGNSDGQNSASLEINLSEVYGELAAKGEAQVDVKKVSVKREGGKLLLLVDTDQDKEPVLKIELDFIEGFEEAF